MKSGTDPSISRRLTLPQDRRQGFGRRCRNAYVQTHWFLTYCRLHALKKHWQSCWKSHQNKNLSTFAVSFYRGRRCKAGCSCSCSRCRRRRYTPLSTPTILRVCFHRLPLPLCSTRFVNFTRFAFSKASLIATIVHKVPHASFRNPTMFAQMPTRLGTRHFFFSQKNLL